MSKMWSLKKNIMTAAASKMKKKAAPEVKDQTKSAAEEDKSVLATRYMTFEEGQLLVLQHLPHRPIRDYQAFKPQATERARPLPPLQWDS